MERRFNCYGIIFLFLFFSCQKKTSEKAPHVKNWPSIQEPLNNSFTSKRFELGESLFFEKRLSNNNKISCGTCHIPELAFADSLKISPGVTNEHFGFRNTPSILNIAYAPYLMAEGGVPSLEHFSIAPLIEKNEMGQNIAISVQKIEKDPRYISLFKEAYDTLPSIKYLARALAVYQRYLLSKGSKYDAFLSGNISKFSASERRGYDLFFSKKTQCSSCHSGFLFSDFQFYNLGLKSSDLGRKRLTGLESDLGKFKTPSLRNLSYTAPYMHDGRYESLEEVLQFYNHGPQVIGPNTSTKIKELALNNEEISDIISFLLTLNDTITYKTPTH